MDSIDTPPSTSLSGRRILVTGAGGYIGCVLVDELMARGAVVIALDRFFFGRHRLTDNEASDRLILLRKDIRDVVAADMEAVDGVIDLAALSNDPSGDLDPALTYSINCEGRKGVANAAKAAGVPRLVLSSTCSIYGAADHGISDETTPPKPISIYARSNLEAETAILAMSDDGFTATALRNATVFGLSRRMRFDLVVNLMTLSAFESNEITILGGGKQWRPLVHVRDAARALITALTADPSVISGRAFNVGVDCYQVRTIAATVREVLPFPVQLSIAPDDPDRRNYRVSFDRLRSELGFVPRTSLEEGIAEIYEALKTGAVENALECSTVRWYKHLLDAKRVLAEVELDGRLL